MATKPSRTTTSATLQRRTTLCCRDIIPWLANGQAQGLQIARALARPSRILIFDECTSSLDGENQAKVLDTIREAKLGGTTVMVMHKLEVMMMCDLVVDGGEVWEQGTHDELMQRKGIFASLASGGEWVGEWYLIVRSLLDSFSSSWFIIFVFITIFIHFRSHMPFIGDEPDCIIPSLQLTLCILLQPHDIVCGV